MQVSSPFVSIIIPTYNRGEILCDTVAMALAQDYPDFEVIVVDQSPEPPAMVREFVKTASERLRYVRRQIPNLPAARNTGVRIARGEIIVFIDDDVIIGPEYVTAHVRQYRDPSVGGAGGLTLPAGDCDEAEVLRQHIFDTLESLPDGTFLAETVVGGNCSFRKGAIFDAGMFDENYTGSALGEETDLALRVRHKGHRLIFDPRIRLVHLALNSGGCANREEVESQRVQNEHCKLTLYLCLRTLAVRGIGRNLSRIWSMYRYYALNRNKLSSPRVFARCHYKFVRNLLAAGLMCLKGPTVSEPDNVA